MGEIDLVDPESNTVHLVDGRTLGYDYLVIATGTTPRPDQTEGMLGPEWHKSVTEFYTYDGAIATRRALESFTGGRLLMHITEMPIKCPVAPLEFVFLADDYFTKRGIRDRVEIVYVTPLDGAFTKPVASRELGDALKERNIALETDFMIESIDQEAKVIRSYDEREVAYDLLVTVPLNMGADYVAKSGPGRRAQLRPGRQAHPAVHRAREHLRPRRRQQHPHLEGRLRGALLRRRVRGELRRSWPRASR